tara:strand:- start:316 stop:1302 length:987 start_codon:yes stop_codon:yes gene_type:complete
MNHKPLAIVLGEPYSTFQEIILKSLKNKKISKFKRPLLFIGCSGLFKKQMLNLNYSYKINIIKLNELKKIKVNKKTINFIDINFKYKKIFDKISSKSNNYINKSFSVALNLLKQKKVFGMINGPVSKKHFLEKKFLGVTEYLKDKTNKNYNPVMLIYNPKLSVSPITTHLPIKQVAKKINKKNIISNVIEINKFYKQKLKKKPSISILGLNPHCETVSKFSEEEKIIIPAIKILLKKKINIDGPFPADTFFFKRNINKYDVVVGMYHDQVLVPIKTLFNFNAINITLGLPFIRVSPDHGTNNKMIGLNKSDYNSFITAINFFKKINAN